MTRQPATRRLRGLAVAALLASLLASLLAPAEARAERLSSEELARLLGGEVVRRPLDLELPGGDYFGGIAYVLIDAPAAEVMAVLLDRGAYGAILPLTVEARDDGPAPDGDRRVFFRHGGRLGTAAYTAVVHRQSPFVLRYWLDRARPHDIGDCWGYFRVDGLGPRRAVLTYAAVLHLDAGLMKLLFREKIRSYALGTPLLVRRYVEGHARAAGQAAPGS